MSMTIGSFVGGHPVRIYAGCTFDPSVRKYRGGHVVAELPYSGRMLSAKVSQSPAEPLAFGDTLIPVRTAQVFTDVDPLPPEEECRFCVVSALYVAACRSLGLDTSRLLTIGDTVVDDEGRPCGCICLNRN